MPGFYGAVGADHPSAAAGLERALLHGSAYESLSAVAAGFTGGCVRRKGLHDTFAPHTDGSNSGTLSILFQGRLYGTRSDEPSTRALTEAETFSLIASAYREKGQNFPSVLDGNFAIGLWDEAANTLLLATDRFGIHRIYYTAQSGGLLFAPECKALWEVLPGKKTIDKVALAEFIQFKYPLLDRTFFEETKLLPFGEVLVWSPEGLTSHCYAPWPIPQGGPEGTYEDRLEHFTALLDTCIQRGHDPGEQVILPLSGGMDSRLLAAALEGQEPTPLCITYGQRDNQEAIIARQVADSMGYPLEVVPFDAGAFTASVPLISYLCDGMHNPRSAIDVELWRQRGDCGKVVLAGYMGDLFAGSFHMRHMDLVNGAAPLSLEALRAEAFRTFSLFPSPVGRADFGLGGRDVEEGVHADLDAQFRPFTEAGRNAIEALEFMQMVPCQARYIANGFNMFRYHWDARCPIVDYDLLALVLRQPLHERASYRLYKDAFCRISPKLARLPFHETHVPIQESWWTPHAAKFHKYRHYSKYALRRAVERGTRGRVNPKLRRYYTHYHAWLREDWRAWAAGELLENDTVRALGWSDEAVRWLLREHNTARKDYSFLLMNALAVKQWYDLFVAGDGPVRDRLDDSIRTSFFEAG